MCGLSQLCVRLVKHLFDIPVLLYFKDLRFRSFLMRRVKNCATCGENRSVGTVTLGVNSKLSLLSTIAYCSRATGILARGKRVSQWLLSSLYTKGYFALRRPPKKTFACK